MNKTHERILDIKSVVEFENSLTYSFVNLYTLVRLSVTSPHVS